MTKRKLKTIAGGQRFKVDISDAEINAHDYWIYTQGRLFPVEETPNSVLFAVSEIIKSSPVSASNNLECDDIPNKSTPVYLNDRGWELMGEGKKAA